ncbi:serine/threonine-protein kinase fray2-like, partial [Aphis craccivora]
MEHTEVQIVNTIITEDREKIYDKEGTQIKISNNLTTDQHNQTIKLLKQFIHIFSTDTINIKPANKEKNNYRLVISYKDLSNIIESDQYPFPRTIYLFRSLEGSKYFTTLDLNSGFFQIPVREQDQYMLAFTI